MDPQKNQPNYLTIFLGIALAWVIFQKNNEPKPVEKTIEAVTKQVFLDQKAGFKAAFENAASKVDSGEIKSDRELLDYVKPLTSQARLQSQAAFDTAFEQAMPDGEFGTRKGEVATLLRRIAKSW